MKALGKMKAGNAAGHWIDVMIWREIWIDVMVELSLSMLDGRGMWDEWVLSVIFKVKRMQRVVGYIGE